MPDEDRTEEAGEKLLTALVQFQRLRGKNFEEKKRENKPCKHSDILILFALKQMESGCPDGVSISELSRELHVKSPTVTPTVYHLETLKLVARDTDRKDRRIIRVRLTEEGNRLLSDQQKHFAAYVKGLVHYLGVEKSIVFANLLNEVYVYESSKSHENSKHHNP
ncbi:MarR family winged helix-turn-helix transcriptional regulator [Caproicibacter sp.]|uniref:MarR family winged helix-turn-helix transcriptional regulator n=1 Tax=Caproicibacter sp. TaxID=2814884 RepID=UPI003988AAA7